MEVPEREVLGTLAWRRPGPRRSKVGVGGQVTDGDRGSDVDWVESTEYGSWGVNYLFGEWLIQPKGQSHDVLELEHQGFELCSNETL